MTDKRAAAEEAEDKAEQLACFDLFGRETNYLARSSFFLLSFVGFLLVVFGSLNRGQ